MNHGPWLEPVLGPKYEDAGELAVADWDGTVRLGCTCGWRDSRISVAASDWLADAWRQHVTADLFGREHRRQH